MAPSSDQLVWWILGLYGFLQILHLILAVWRFTRPDPPLREILKEYVTRERFEAFEKASIANHNTGMALISARLDGIHESQGKIRDTTQTLFREVMKQIGVLEGKIENIKPRCNHD